MSSNNRKGSIGARVRRLIAISLAASLWSGMHLAPARAADTRREYDPAACKRSAQGNRYVALGPYVLALPYSKRAAYMIDPLRPGDIGLVPPDPAEPEGCPDNPLQSWSFEFIGAPFALTAEGGTPAAGGGARADRLTLYRALRHRPTPSAGDREWAGADLMRMLWDKFCEQAAVREELPDGLTACRIRPNGDAQVEDWGATYRARLDVYATPLGHPFIVACGLLLRQSTVGHCDVAYTMMPGLGVGYRFQPYLGPHPIPFGRIIAYDRGLRAALESTLVKDYAWKGEMPIGAERKK